MRVCLARALPTGGNDGKTVSPGDACRGTGQQRIALDAHVDCEPKNRSHFFVAIGSAANRAVEPLPSATIQQFNLNGSDQKTFASGLRNPVGMAFYPQTDDLYVVVNERDRLGDDLVPDFLTRVEAGDFFRLALCLYRTAPGS